MKFALVLAFAILGLVSVAANSVPVENTVNIDVVQSQEIEDEDLFFNPISWLHKLFSKFYWALKKALRTVKGVNCSIKGVQEIKQAALDFPQNVKSCGNIVNKQLQKVLNDVNNALSDSVNILTYQTTLCNQVDSTAETKTSSKCFNKLIGTFWTLYLETTSAINDAQKVKTSAGDSGNCVKNLISTLKSKFTNFSSNVKSCSKLV